MNIFNMGDSALMVETPDAQTAQNLRGLLGTAVLPGIYELVPGYRSLLIRFDPVLLDAEGLERHLAEYKDIPPVTALPRNHEFEVRYDGVDLESVAGELGISIDEVVRLHTAPVYSVAFLGFAPGFPYLTGLDPRLKLPRLSTPRTRVPSGSVAMVDEFSGIYPHAIPGGWRLLGKTEVTLFDTVRAQPALLAPGDQVRFRAQL